MKPTTRTFPVLLQDFFAKRLVLERGASPRTVAGYRDAFELLLRFAQTRTGRTPSALTIEDLDAPLVLEFLEHLESERGNCPRTRNTRLAAIRSFMHYVSVREPTTLAIAQRVLAIPNKRFDRPVLGFLSRTEVEALLDAPDRSTWSGARDTILFRTLYNTGARVSEIVDLRIADVLLDRDMAVQLRGKGRKQRAIPLWKSTAEALRAWFTQIDRDPAAPVFPNRTGKSLSRSGVAKRLRLAVTIAAEECPTLVGRRISPHTLRHTTAMHMLQRGVDISVIAIWLGHENPSTTHHYIEADLAMKEAALHRLDEPPAPNSRYRATDSLLAFLEAL